MSLLFAWAMQAAVPLPPLHGGHAATVCPVGGERFQAWRATSYSIYGERPDGKPYSYLPFPLPLPECPGNGLILFDVFTASEIAILTRLVVDPAYRRLADTETSHYRAYWLASKLGRPKPQALGLLLSAIWQVSPGTMAQSASEDRRLPRYQDEFVRLVTQLDSAIDGRDRVWLLARAANAARQRERYGEAERLRRRAEASLAGLSDRGGWPAWLTRLQAVIARRDPGIEPLDMIPKQAVALACMDRQATTPFDRAICAQPQTAAETARLRATRP